MKIFCEIVQDKSVDGYRQDIIFPLYLNQVSLGKHDFKTCNLFWSLNTTHNSSGYVQLHAAAE